MFTKWLHSFKKDERQIPETSILVLDVGLKSVSQHERGFGTGFRPNYSRNVEEVYIDFARWYLTSQEILRRCRHTVSNEPAYKHQITVLDG